jgi:hypothetical protein
VILTLGDEMEDAEWQCISGAYLPRWARCAMSLS